MDTSVRVLLVDDEPGIRHVLGALIRDFGYNVHTAESAREALEAFTANPFPIVVTDIRMPGMDGLALLERVRNQNPDTQVVMITGHGDMDNAVECLRLGAADFIAKPVNDDLLEHSAETCRRTILSARTDPPLHRTPGGARRLAHAEPRKPTGSPSWAKPWPVWPTPSKTSRRRSKGASLSSSRGWSPGTGSISTTAGPCSKKTFRGCATSSCTCCISGSRRNCANALWTRCSPSAMWSSVWKAGPPV
ncbi:MAG: sigma-54-dependent transcriptional regulator [Bilophila wadsworthia]